MLNLFQHPPGGTLPGCGRISCAPYGKVALPRLFRYRRASRRVIPGG